MAASKGKRIRHRVQKPSFEDYETAWGAITVGNFMSSFKTYEKRRDELEKAKAHRHTDDQEGDLEEGRTFDSNATIVQ